MKIDLLVAEIGSTTTLVTAFDDLNTTNPRFLGQGRALTTVDQGDVTIGVANAQADLGRNLGKNCQAADLRATSSAAGGLRMSVHGLAYDMTVRAAREGALGAGAVIRLVTAGKLNRRQQQELVKLNPNLILLAGGVDYGDEEVAWHNAKVLQETLTEHDLQIPLIYAGNVVLQCAIEELFSEAQLPIFICPNVYPSIDQLQVDELRRVIQQVFEKHIITAPGMESIRHQFSGGLYPTPAAVMESAQLLQKELGDLAVVDLGGATTDVHSVAEGTEKVQSMLLAPEPKAKRTVEGDLGVYKNARYLQELSGGARERFVPPIPQEDEEVSCVLNLAQIAVTNALARHAGKYVYRFGVTGRQTYATGKDLTGLEYVIGTGGVFANLDPQGKLLHTALSQIKEGLLPKKGVKVLVDRQYLMSALGTICHSHPQDVLKLLKSSLFGERRV